MCGEKDKQLKEKNDELKRRQKELGEKNEQLEERDQRLERLESDGKETQKRLQEKDKLVVISGGGNIGAGEWEVETIGCKIGSRGYCATRGIEPIFFNNCKWKVSFKNCMKCLKNFFKLW